MKVYLVTFLFISIGALYAQVPQYAHECSTPNLEESNAVSLPYFGNNQVIENYLVNNGYDDLPYISFPSSNPLARTENGTFLRPKFLVPLNIFIYWNGTNNVGNAITQADANEYVCLVNEVFREAGTSIQFYANNVAVENNDAYSTGIRSDIDKIAMWASKRGSTPSYGKAINVHFIRNNGGNEDAAGSASGPQFVVPFTKYSLYVRTHNNPSGGQRADANIVGTFAHELGHVLGLLHTHHPGRIPSNLFNADNATISNGCYQESVSRAKKNYWYEGCVSTDGKKKCSVNGDFLCDTAADPNQGDGRTNANCIYQHPAGGDFRIDNWNALWQPPNNNIMALLPGDCRTEFSRHQIGIMWMEMPGLQSFIGSLSPSVSGGSPLCTSSRNYTINNIPAGYDVVWSVEPANLVAQSTGTGRTATLRAASSGSKGYVNINFDLIDNDCAIMSVVKRVWVGSPNTSNAQINGGGTLNWYATYGFSVSGDLFANRFEWVIPSGWQISAFGNKRSASITPTTTGQHNIYVRAYNNCGFSYLQSIQVCVKGNGYSCGGSGGGGDPGGPHPYIVINPNPVQDNLEITFNNVEEIEEYFGATNKTYQVEIVDLNGESCIHGSLNKNGLRINVKHLDPGLYIVNVSDKDHNYQYRLLKE